MGCCEDSRRLSVQKRPQPRLESLLHFPWGWGGKESSGTGPRMLSNRWLLGSLLGQVSPQHVWASLISHSHLSVNRLSRPLLREDRTEEEETQGETTGPPQEKEGPRTEESQAEEKGLIQQCMEKANCRVRRTALGHQSRKWVNV